MKVRKTCKNVFNKNWLFLILCLIHQKCRSIAASQLTSTARGSHIAKQMKVMTILVEALYCNLIIWFYLRRNKWILKKKIKQQAQENHFWTFYSENEFALMSC